MSNKGISIVICTYNGGDILPETLRHIANQQVPSDLAWEVIIVDNASTDNSALIVHTEWANHNCSAPLYVLKQSKPGLNFAREMGFAYARYSYIIMCDDDNWLASNYITISYSIMDLNPAIGMLGGQGKIKYETPPPDWVVAYPIHASGSQATVSGKVAHHGVYGAASVMRKAAYSAICEAGFQFLLTDRRGNQLSSGGDFELCHALAMANYLIWYDERLQFTHYITSNRITWAYYINYLNTDALSFSVLEPYKIYLDTNSDSLLTFGTVLLKNVSYYTTAFLYYALIGSRKALTETDRKIIMLKMIQLKARIRSYKHCLRMSQNFLMATKFRQRFNQQQMAKQETDRVGTYGREKV